MQVPAWATAAMLDYVFTDDRRAVWDNNGGRDFHTLLKEYASGASPGCWLHCTVADCTALGSPVPAVPPSLAQATSWCAVERRQIRPIFRSPSSLAH